jgi:GntR family carbon starvation induced transcriptional regulator
VTLATYFFEQLRSDILHCRLEPGTRLLFGTLRKRYGASLSPVREALMRLAAEGLTQFIDQKGFRVPPVSREELVDVANTLLEVEALVVRLAIENGDHRWEVSIKARLQELSTRDRFHVADVDFERREAVFRETLYDACGSRWLVALCRQLVDRFSRYRHFHARRPEAARVVGGEYVKVMRAVVSRDEDEAIRLLRRYRSTTTETILAQWPSTAGCA